MLLCSPELHQKSTGQNVSLGAIGRSLPERQRKLLRICIWEQATSPFDESWGHGKIFCNSFHRSQKVWGKHANMPNQCMYPCLAFGKLIPDCAHLFRPGLGVPGNLAHAYPDLAGPAGGEQEGRRESWRGERNMSILSIFKLLILPELSGIEKQSSAFNNCRDSVIDEDEKQISGLVERATIYRGLEGASKCWECRMKIIFRELLFKTLSMQWLLKPHHFSD